MNLFVKFALRPFACIFALFAATAASAQQCDTSPIFVQNASAWLSGAVEPGIDMLVADGRIAAIGRSGTIAAPADARTVDATGKTLLPGFIDAHSHMLGPPPPTVDALSGENQPVAIAATMRQTLRSGVTSTRTHLFNLAHGPELKRNSADPCHPSPRIQLGGPGFFVGDNEDRGQIWFVGADDDPRAMVREAAEAGVDWIALHQLDQMPAETRDAIAAEAAARGIRLMAESYNPAQMTAALAAGIESLEYLFEAEEAEYSEALLARIGSRADPVYMGLPIGWHGLMHEAFADPDILAEPGLYEFYPDEIAAELREAHLETARAGPEFPLRPLDRLHERFLQLHDAGARLVIATDSGSNFHFQRQAIWREFAAWQALGIDAEEIIAAATTTPAELLKDEAAGTLRPGAYGDFLLYEGDPREGALDDDRLDMVVKGGVIYVADGEWTGS